MHECNMYWQKRNHRQVAPERLQDENDRELNLSDDSAKGKGRMKSERHDKRSTGLNDKLGVELECKREERRVRAESQ